MSSKVRYIFDDFTLDAQIRVLYKNDELVALEPRVIDMLILLVEQRETIVSKELLLARVWGKVVVEEGVIRRNISLMRAALDPHSAERYIRTYKGSGYRFEAALTEEIIPDTTGIPTPPLSPPIHANQPEFVLAPHKLRSFSNFLRRYQWPLLLISASALAIYLLLPMMLAMGGPRFVAKQITSNSGEQMVTAAAISPEGNLIAFADDNNLYVSDIETVERHPHPLLQGTVPIYIDWFADGIHLLISGVRPDSSERFVWRMSSLGGQPQLLFQDARMAAPSPDNKQISFVRGENQLWIADNDTLQARLLRVTGPRETITTRPRFSPDGEYILLAATTTDSSITTIEAINIRSGKAVHVYSTDDYIADFMPLDNNTLIMARNTHSFAITSELVSMKINMRDGGYSRLRVVNRSMNQPAWTLSATRDGSKLVALNGRITSSVFVADLIDEGRQMTNARRFTMDNYISRPGAWLADNRTLVYYSNRGGHFNLFSRNIDDADARSMVQDDEEKYWPTITADQQWMFYFIDLAKQHGSDTELALVRYSMVDGKTKVIDTKPDAYRSLRCAISTNRCVIMEHTGNEGIYYEFDPLIGRGKQLAKTRWTPVKSYSYWDLSPDGSQIGFIDSVNDPMGIGIIAINENPVKVFMLHVNDTNPLRTLRWDAQGKGFYVSSFDSAGDLLKLLHVELNGNVQLLRWQVGSNDGRAIPSPDGKRLAFQQNMLNSNIWMLQREFEQ